MPAVKAVPLPTRAYTRNILGVDLPSEARSPESTRELIKVSSRSPSLQEGDPDRRLLCPAVSGKNDAIPDGSGIPEEPPGTPLLTEAE